MPPPGAEENAWVPLKAEGGSISFAQLQGATEERRPVFHLSRTLQGGNLISAFMSELKSSTCLGCPPRSQVAQGERLPEAEAGLDCGVQRKQPHANSLL